MEELRVSLPVQIGSPKHLGDTTIRNGTFQNQNVTLVDSSDDVLEKDVRSKHVLRFLATTDNGTKIFDPYLMTLEELMLCLEKNGDKSKIEQLDCTPQERSLLLNFKFLDSNNHQTKEGVDLLRDVIEGLYALYFNGLLHGDLTLSNIVICSDEGKLIAKLTRIKGEYTDTKDYYSLGSIVKRCFSFDNCSLPPEVDEFLNCVWMMGTKTKGLPEMEWTELANLRETRFYEDPRTIFRHPLFWSADLCITFIIQFRMLMSKCSKGRPCQPVSRFMSAMDKVKTKDWYKNLDDVVKDETADNRTTDETQYLLRLIRNTYCHFDDHSDDFKDTVGTPPDKLFEYFRAKYPYMLLGVHRVLQYHFEDVQKSIKFSYSFDIYL